MSSKTVLPVVIPKSGRVTLGGVKQQRDTFALDVKNQSLSDIRKWSIDILNDSLVEQDKLSNKPSSITIDRKPNRPIKAFDREGEILFGNVLQRGLIRQVEIELKKAILKATDIDTGRLSDISSSWDWFYYDGRSKRRKVQPESIKSLSGSQRLTLIPNVEYAGWANTMAKRKREGKRPTGFMAAVSKKLRRSVNFRGSFSVFVTFIDTPESTDKRVPVLNIQSKRGGK